jgi:hypothetical protein
METTGFSRWSFITENPPLRPYVKTPMPVAQGGTKEVLPLPVHPALSEDTHFDRVKGERASNMRLRGYSAPSLPFRQTLRRHISRSCPRNQIVQDQVIGICSVLIEQSGLLLMALEKRYPEP